MTRVYIDFETYYDRECTLAKLSVPEYVRHPKFRVLGCAVAIDEAPPMWVEDIRTLPVDWSQAEVIAFNQLFDGYILTEHYGITPKRFGCALGLCRLHTNLTSYHLKDVAPLLLGKQKLDMATERLDTYALRDVELCRDLWELFLPVTSQRELDLLHVTLKHSCQSLLQLNTEVLRRGYEAEQEARQEAIKASGVDEATLQSNVKFAALLKSLGLDLPTKINDNGDETAALAKNDPEFVELMQKYPEHSKLWEARLAAKSVGMLRRYERLLALGTSMPAQLNYCGATTTKRWSGASKLNLQNLKRGSPLRQAICPPSGYKLLSADLDQIELRIALWLSGEHSWLKYLAEGGDLYRRIAAQYLYHKDEGSVTTQERAVAKATVLGCQYGLGAATFVRYMAGGPLGMPPLFLAPHEAVSIVESFRRSVPKLTKTWRMLDEALHCVWRERPRLRLLGFTFERDGSTVCIRNPVGNVLSYPLFVSRDDGLFYHAGKASLWGGKLLENLVQNLAREILAEKILQLANHYNILCTIHDEIWVAIKDDQDKAIVDEIMAQPVEWAEDLPLSVKSKIKED